MSQQAKPKLLDDTADNSSTYSPPLHVYILVNSRSGSWHGRQLLSKFPNNKTTIANRSKPQNFTFCDLYNRQKRQTCFYEINRLTQQGQPVRIVVSGGDGTVEWVLGLAVKFGVDFGKVVFGVLPIGTGNDFARSLGWGKFRFNHKKLSELAEQLEQAEIGHYDIWESSISCYQSGKITEIKNGVQRELKGTYLRKNFSNYFGVGTDARISYFAQKINAKSVLLKKISYGFAWLASLCRYSHKLIKQLRSFTTESDEPQNPLKLTRQLQLSNSINFSNSQTLNNESTIMLNPNDSCITFLNSTSSMELDHIWKTPYAVQPNKIYRNQQIDDGIIEVVSYRNQFSLLLERSMHMATKVAQGSGPFVMKFRQPKKGQKQQAYIHINGEPYKVANIKQIKISKSREVALGRIKVLMCKQ